MSVFPNGIVSQGATLVASWEATGGSCGVYVGSGTPEGVVSASRGSIFHQTDSLGEAWRKTTVSGNTGWVEIGTGGSGGGSSFREVADITARDAIATGSFGATDLHLVRTTQNGVTYRWETSAWVAVESIQHGTSSEWQTRKNANATTNEFVAGQLWDNTTEHRVYEYIGPTSDDWVDISR